MLDQIKTSEVNFYVNTIDKKAPRFRVSKFRHNIINKEMVERFANETGIKTDLARFKQIVKAISETIIDNVMTERNGIQLPEQMGKNWLGLFKSTKDLSKYPGAETNYFNSHNNLETGGFVGKIVWDFRGLKYKVKNREMYMFIPHRNFKTEASKNFRNNSEIYLKIDNVHKKLEKAKMIEQIKNEQQNNTTTSE